VSGLASVGEFITAFSVEAGAHRSKLRVGSSACVGSIDGDASSAFVRRRIVDTLIMQPQYSGDYAPAMA
jgi:hypothetical protein